MVFARNHVAEGQGNVGPWDFQRSGCIADGHISELGPNTPVPNAAQGVEL